MNGRREENNTGICFVECDWILCGWNEWKLRVCQSLQIFIQTSPISNLLIAYWELNKPFETFIPIVYQLYNKFVLIFNSFFLISSLPRFFSLICSALLIFLYIFFFGCCFDQMILITIAHRWNRGKKTTLWESKHESGIKWWWSNEIEYVLIDVSQAKMCAYIWNESEMPALAQLPLTHFQRITTAIARNLSLATCSTKWIN